MLSDENKRAKYDNSGDMDLEAGSKKRCKRGHKAVRCILITGLRRGDLHGNGERRRAAHPKSESAYGKQRQREHLLRG